MTIAEALKCSVFSNAIPCRGVECQYYRGSGASADGYFIVCDRDQLMLDAADMLEGEMVDIKIKYFDKDMEKIEKIEKGDWIDLRARERVEMKEGDLRIIPLGVGMVLPDGYEAIVLPRSSTPKKFGIEMSNSAGVIDNSYSGDGDEWGFVARAIRDTVIEKGDRICQFRIQRNQPQINLIEVEHLNDKDRGGFGSTGV